jgi:nucleoside-diphosphate-sugar epimerase
MPVRAAARSPDRVEGDVERVAIPDLSSTTDWTAALLGVDIVIHAAARVHIMRDVAADPLAEFRRINVEGTMRLAMSAAAAGARRFVFISSIKVNGEGTRPGQPYTADGPAAPLDPYGISKHEAEVALRDLGRRTGMEIVIIRPVLVYGPGVKGNFGAMLRLIARGLPLPFGAVQNRRSLVALDNLVDLIVTCTNHPAAANETFLVCDGEDVSTTELFRRAARASGRHVVLVPIPVAVIRGVLVALGRGGLANRLFGWLQVDQGKTRRLLDWVPPITLDEGLRRMAGRS